MSPIDNDRRLQLLADRALGGLDPSEAAELAELTDQDDPDGLALELAAAAVALARVEGMGLPDLPENLVARVERRALQANSSRATSRASAPRRRVPLVGWAGWLAAAASIALVVYDRSNPEPQPVIGPPPPPSVASPRDRFAFAPSRPLVATAHPLARGAGGTVVWDGTRQEGYLQIKGLAPVDPKSGCYQLWVFDAKRDGRYPVDGGMFTVTSTTGDEVVAVRPRIPVREPTLFAVTLEPPGGVVVSDRERILLTAEWGSQPSDDSTAR